MSNNNFTFDKTPYTFDFPDLDFWFWFFHVFSVVLQAHLLLVNCIC